MFTTSNPSSFSYQNLQDIEDPGSPESPTAKETGSVKFARFCGFDGKTRIYGDGEISGRIANLKYNRFLKRSGTENPNPSRAASDATSFTQEAFYVEVDTDSLTQKRDANIIGALLGRHLSTLRVKEIKYGNHNAMWEILSGHLYGLTGLTAPDSKLLVHEDYGTRADGTPKVFVASPLVTGYSDLGDFLVNPSIQRFIKADSQPTWLDAKEEIERINNLHKSQGAITATDKMRRLEMLGTIYKLLPDYFHTEIEKSFIASKFIANWDFANLSLNNIGCRFTLDKGGNVVGFESVFVDFGNSGANGFGGKYKEDSLERANTEAKPRALKPKDYDPALAFTQKELEMIEAKARQIAFEKNSSLINATEEQWRAQISAAILAFSKELADAETESKPMPAEDAKLRRSIISKDAHHIFPHEAGLKINPSKSKTMETVGLLTVSDLPRNRPIAILLEPAIKWKTKKITDKISEIGESAQTNWEDFNQLTENLKSAEPEFRQSLQDIYRNSEIEMAYRLSLIPDSAIDHVVNKWYLCAEFPTIFPLPEKFKDDPKYATAEGVAQIFKERRDDLVKIIPQQVIKDWCSKNIDKALAAEEEVELAVLKKTTTINPDFHTNPENISYPSLASAPNKFKARACSADEIIKQIEEHKRQINESEITKSTLGKIAQLKHVSNATNSPEVQEVLQKEIDLTKAELDNKQLEDTLDFIQSNLSDWRIALGLIEPNCSLFNFKQKKDLHCFRNYPNNSPPIADRVLTREEFAKTNQNLYEANLFAYEKFMAILTEISNSKPTYKSTVSISEPLQSSSKLTKLP